MISDTDGLWNPNLKKPCIFSEPPVRNCRKIPKTLFGREWLVVAIDEAHVARKINKAYVGAFQLRLRAKVPIAMTATPILTGLMVSHASFVLRVLEGNSRDVGSECSIEGTLNITR